MYTQQEREKNVQEYKHITNVIEHPPKIKTRKDKIRVSIIRSSDVSPILVGSPVHARAEQRRPKSLISAYRRHRVNVCEMGKRVNETSPIHTVFLAHSAHPTTPVTFPAGEPALLLSQPWSSLA